AVFVDSNVLVYARQGNEPIKQPICARWLEQLWRDRLGRTSMQVVSETYVTLTRKIKPALPGVVAWGYVSALFAWDPKPVDAPVIRRAREIEPRYRLAWWDCLIVASAQLQNCPLLLSEDLQDGAVYGSVTVRSPLKLSLSEPRAAYAPIPDVTVSHRPRGRPKRDGA
ncbi:MAG: PIN domain-containing protein, partial [Steroidobacteraceae bacterium]